MGSVVTQFTNYHLNSDFYSLIKITTVLFQKSQSFVEIRNQHFVHTDE